MAIAERKQLENTHSSANRVCLSRHRNPTCPFVIGHRSEAKHHVAEESGLERTSNPIAGQISPLRCAPVEMTMRLATVRPRHTNYRIAGVSARGMPARAAGGSH